MSENAPLPRNIDIRGSGLPRRLMALRRQANLSRADLAEKAGITERTVRDLESGRRPAVQEKTLSLIAGALGMSVQELLAQPPPVSAPKPRRLSIGLRLLPALAVILAGAILWSADSAGILGVRWEEDGQGISVYSQATQRALWRTDHEVNIRGACLAPWEDSDILTYGLDSGRQTGQFLTRDLRSGEVLWSTSIGAEEAAMMFNDSVNDGGGFHCRGFAFGDLDGDGVSEVILRFMHDLHSPSVVRACDRHGDILGTYANHGHILSLLCDDLDGDGKDEVLAVGTGKGFSRPGATVILFDAEHFSGASVDRPSRLKPQLLDDSVARLVLPNFEDRHMELLGETRLMSSRIETYHNPAGGVNIHLFVMHNMPVIVKLDASLNPISALPSDALVTHVRSWPASDQDLVSAAHLSRWLERRLLFQNGTLVPTPRN